MNPAPVEIAIYDPNDNDGVFQIIIFNLVFTFWLLKFKIAIKANVDRNFSILVNNGPGSFSTIRTALSIAKGIKISSNVKIFGFKDEDLLQFNLENIEVLINKNLIENKLIKPLYFS